VTYLITCALLLLPLHALAVAGLWRAAYFPLRTPPTPVGWQVRLPLEAVDRKEAGPLWPLRWWAERYLPHYLQRPLITCPACMATVWGPLPYFYLVGEVPQALPFYLLYWPALSAAGAAVGKWINPEE
jgi:hypothetical protein